MIGVWFGDLFLPIRKEKKREMFVVSFWTSFRDSLNQFLCRRYWSPPSLFDLAMKTGFDVESFIFLLALVGLRL